MSERRFDVRTARLNRQMSQTDLARAIDVSGSYLSLIESGHRRVTPALRERLEAVLGPVEGWRSLEAQLLQARGEADRWHGLYCELRVSVADLEAGIRDLFTDVWRKTPCGCGHRADLHKLDEGICLGGLTLCECRWSFTRIIHERARALVGDETPQPTEEKP